MLGFLYNQIITLLTTSPGNLVYHLVLAFSIAGALPGALDLWPRSGVLAGRRMVLGLGLLLLSQLGLIALASLGAYFPTFNVWLPVLDRSMTALGVVLLIWLWAFPTPSRSADLASILLALLVLALAFFTAIWRSAGAGGDSSFNGSPPDLLWSGFSLVMAAGGGLLVLRRRPPGFETGLAVFLLLLLGFFVHLLLPLPQSDYSGAVRLAQIAAYPLLLTLPTRFASILSDGEREGAGRSRAGVKLKVFQHFISLATRSSQLELCRGITGAVAHAVPADICLLFSPPDANKVISIHCGYNLSAAEFMPAATFDGQIVPVVAEALRQGRPLHLPAGGNIPDLASLENILGLPLSGSLLLSPLASPGGEVLMALVLLTPFTGRKWTADDQNYLADIAAPLGVVLHQANRLRGFEENLAQADRAFQNLQSENQRLSETLLNLSRNRDSLPADTEDLQEILRETLEENANLQRALAGAEKDLSMKKTAPLPGNKLESISAIAQDMRQPVTSILEYTGLLLGDTPGALSTSHRQIVERLKTSANRLNLLADALIKTTLNGPPGYLPAELLDLNALIADVVDQASPRIQEKGLALSLDVSGSLPSVTTGQGAFRQALTFLLNNAALATPAPGEIGLRAVLNADQEDHSSVLVQITDQGGGISPEDRDRLFSPHSPAEELVIPGLGETSWNVSLVKSLLEASGGQLWLESDPGRGSTFNIRLQATQGSLPLGDPGEMVHETQPVLKSKSKRRSGAVK